MERTAIHKPFIAMTHDTYRYLRTEVLKFSLAQGCCYEDAEDRTQDLFYHLLRKDAMESLNARAENLEHLRNLFLVAARRISIDQYRKASAQKRQGPQHRIKAKEKSRLDDTPVEDRTPSAIAQSREALAAAIESLRKIGETYARKGKGQTFRAIRDQILLGPPRVHYGRLAQTLQLSESGLRTMVCRVRQELRALRDQREAAEGIAA